MNSDAAPASIEEIRNRMKRTYPIEDDGQISLNFWKRGVMDQETFNWYNEKGRYPIDINDEHWNGYEECEGEILSYIWSPPLDSPLGATRLSYFSPINETNKYYWIKRDDNGDIVYNQHEKAINLISRPSTIPF